MIQFLPLLEITLVTTLLSLLFNFCAYYLTLLDVRKFGAWIEGNKLAKSKQRAFAEGTHRKIFLKNLAIIATAQVTVGFSALVVGDLMVFILFIFPAMLGVDALWDLIVWAYYRYYFG